MLTCKEISKLVSQSLDRKLSFRQRMAMRMHLMMCSWCRTYINQMHTLRRFIRHSVKNDQVNEQQLPEEVRSRIKQTLQQEVDRNK